MKLRTLRNQNLEITAILITADSPPSKKDLSILQELYASCERDLKQKYNVQLQSFKDTTPKTYRYLSKEVEASKSGENWDEARLTRTNDTPAKPRNRKRRTKKK